MSKVYLITKTKIGKDVNVHLAENEPITAKKNKDNQYLRNLGVFFYKIKLVLFLMIYLGSSIGSFGDRFENKWYTCSCTITFVCI